ncbi:MAG: hypothetical protein HBSAPP04_18710 [Ignavibacteriaceae bacterium]|nr:MAG: hypothetical protein HBSAPP04_18710 [Ignavibacteriaceae bacterium]
MPSYVTLPKDLSNLINSMKKKELIGKNFIPKSKISLLRVRILLNYTVVLIKIGNSRHEKVIVSLVRVIFNAFL